MARRAARDIERLYTRAQFVAKLRRLADALEKNKAFTIQVAGERLYIPAEAAFNIEHERAGDENELEFQLLWKDQPDLNDPGLVRAGASGGGRSRTQRRRPRPGRPSRAASRAARSSPRR